MTTYSTPTYTAEARLTERGSRFYGFAAPATSEGEAAGVLVERSHLHHDATHHCWALRVGDPSAPTERSSDAGEPSGTAGRPILVQIQKANLLQVVLVVTRWFGGTKLGTGGLIRAYGECAAQAIALLPTRTERLTVTFTVECPYDLIGLVQQFTVREGGEVMAGDYGEAARIRVRIPLETAPLFSARLMEAAGGRVEVSEEKRRPVE